MTRQTKIYRQVKLLLSVFVAGLILSGVTAFPLNSELAYAHRMIEYFNIDNALSDWIETVYNGVNEVDSKYPFIPYGTDWLAFAHLVLAVLFIGIIKDPVKNIWVIQFGLIACAAVFPLAVIAGTVRGIPWFWQLIDCSFGLIGGVVLWVCYQKVKFLEIRRTGAPNQTYKKVIE
jgi:hypothetical protein